MNSPSQNFKFEVSLRLWHPVMSADDISANLGMAPTTRWDTGSVSDQGHIQRMTYWTCRLRQGSGNLAVSLTKLVQDLEPKRQFLREIEATGGRSELFVGVFLDGNAGELLPANLLRTIGELRIDLALDIYGPSL